MKKNSKSGILLDIGCGPTVRDGFVRLDIDASNNPDIVHDLEVFPYPIRDSQCLTIVASQIVEHINPSLTIKMFNELWRIMKPKGQLVVSTPYAGSAFYWQDPTHCNGFNEMTFQYFNVKHKYYGIYRPKPWTIESGYPVWQSDGVIEVVMRKYEE